MARRAGEAGVTLVEMLVVLAIVGIMAGLVVLGIGAASDRSAEIEAKRLAARLTLAADEAMVSDRPLGLAWDKAGYRFLVEQDGAWRDDRAPALEPHRVASGVTFVATVRSPFRIGGGMPAKMRFSTVKSGWVVLFDGATAKAVAG